MRFFLIASTLALALWGCGDHDTAQISKTPPLQMKRLNAEMSRLEERARPGRLGVAVMNLENDQTYALNGDVPFPMQSVFKAPLAAAVLAEVDAGRLRLDEAITLQGHDLSPPYSPIGAAYPGQRDYTVAELLTAAAGGGDNTAADVLMKRIGGPGMVTAWLQSERIVEVRVDRYERQLQPDVAGLASFRPAWKDEAAYLAALNAVPPGRRREATLAYLHDPRDTATPRDMLNFLHHLDDGQLLSKASTQRLMQIMTETRSGPDRLKAGLPEGARLAHKTGTARTDLGMNPAVNDVGVITLPDGRRYAVAVFLSGSTLAEADRDALIADVARAVVHGVN